MNNSKQTIGRTVTHLLLWTLAGTASAIPFGDLYAAAIQVVAVGSVIFLVLFGTIVELTGLTRRERSEAPR